MPKQVCGSRPHCAALVECPLRFCAACVAKGAGKDTRPSAAQRGYDGKWSVCRKAFLEKHPWCEGLRLQPGGPVVVHTHAGRLQQAGLVDHIVPHRGDKRLFWDRANWQSACKGCHDRKTARHDGGFGHAHTAR